MTKKVIRGGSWINDPGNCRSADRFRFSPGGRVVNYGFRVVF
jgi:formylglycine-generating enzyme required for sulfatase activity